MNRKEMIEKLKQYKREDGTYRLAISADSENSELVKLARELNEQICKQRQREIVERGKEILAKLDDRDEALTEEELDFLFKHGNAD